LNREEFQKKWRRVLIALGMEGSVSAQRDGPLVRATRASDIVDEAPKILAEIEADLTVVLRAEHTAKAAAQQHPKSK
jgi:hypothetical protein